MLGREWGVRSVGERKYRSPLYYPDTLVNPDTCLGSILKLANNSVLFISLDHGYDLFF